MAPTPLDIVLDYHQATKHHFGRYARSLGFLDWSTQPHPFRRFEGVSTRNLDIPSADPGPDWDLLGAAPPAPEPLTAATLGRFFYHSLALSAWKQVTSPQGEVLSRWALRVNPSSGNLHPTEGYILLGPLTGMVSRPAVHHYAPDEHLLEERVSLGEQDWAAIAQVLPADAFLLGLTSIHWREAWKYGERAFRYCQHDVGHALAAVALSAACLGWRADLVGDVSPPGLVALLGSDPQAGPESEHPDGLVLVSPARGCPDTKKLAEVLTHLSGPFTVHGTPNTLSSAHQDWPIIDQVAQATSRPAVTLAPEVIQTTASRETSRGLEAPHLIRQRRSAVSMDGRTSLGRKDFLRLLRRVMPSSGLPWNVLGQTPEVSLVMFVHRVDGLDPGLYCLVRHPEHEASLRACIRPEFSWKQATSSAEDLPLFQWASSDTTQPAQQLSCNQAIAADGVFSLGMLTRFRPALDAHGPGFYRQLFWETGVIGQMLYLEAEAAGLRGTGIGCFFDDEFHKLLGLQDDTWQSMYHFTVGGPTADDRLQTFGAYDHLDR